MDWNQKLMGVGIITRDHMGTVRASMCSVQQYISDPTTTEAFGARLGVEFGCHLRFQSIILEGDAKEVVIALGRDDNGLGKYGSLIVDAREILAGFQSWAVSHVRREGNEAAHQLAKLVVSQ